MHPGETNASWLLKGALQQLLADTEEAARLRNNFVFKVVPMLNPGMLATQGALCAYAAAAGHADSLYAYGLVCPHRSTTAAATAFLEQPQTCTADCVHTCSSGSPYEI